MDSLFLKQLNMKGLMFIGLAVLLCAVVFPVAEGGLFSLIFGTIGNFLSGITSFFFPDPETTFNMEDQLKSKLQSVVDNWQAAGSPKPGPLPADLKTKIQRVIGGVACKAGSTAKLELTSASTSTGGGSIFDMIVHGLDDDLDDLVDGLDDVLGGLGSIVGGLIFGVVDLVIDALMALLDPLVTVAVDVVDDVIEAL